MIVNIKADIPDRWVNTFCSFLKHVERNGKECRSNTIGFFADGNDSSFRPTFEFDVDYQTVKPDFYGNNYYTDYYHLEGTYDAG